MADAIVPLRERMEKTDRVRLTGPGTDLRFSIKGIGVVPVRGPPQPARRRVLHGARARFRERHDHVQHAVALPGHDVTSRCSFTFEGGRIVRATGEPAGQARRAARHRRRRALHRRVLARLQPARPPSDEGHAVRREDRRARSTSRRARPTRIADNGNRSQIHWDLVLIQRPEYGGGEVWFDGELVRKDGLFVVPGARGPEPGALASSPRARRGRESDAMIQLQNLRYSIGPRVLFERLDWVLGARRPRRAGRPERRGQDHADQGPARRDRARVRQRASWRAGRGSATCRRRPPSASTAPCSSARSRRTAQPARHARGAGRAPPVAAGDRARRSRASSALLERAGELQHQLDLHDEHALEPEARRVLAGLGFSRDRPGPARSPSSRAAGACARRSRRCCSPIPRCCSSTSRRTISTCPAMEWLEDYLEEFRGGLVVVSHDRVFLDRVADEVRELDHGELTEYPMTFTRYLEERGAASRADRGAERAARPAHRPARRASSSVSARRTRKRRRRAARRR